MAAKKKVRKDVKLLHKLYDVEKNKKVLYPIPELLTELLCTINMFEGTDEAHMERIVLELSRGPPEPQEPDWAPPGLPGQQGAQEARQGLQGRGLG